MSENPQGQPGSQYTHVPDKVAQLERRVGDLEAVVGEMGELLVSALTQTSQQLRGLGAEG